MAKKKKYYVIWKGFETGIYESWQECRKLIEGYPNAVYKSFPDKASAEHAFYGNPSDFLDKKNTPKAMSAAQKEQYGVPEKESMTAMATVRMMPITGDTPLSSFVSVYLISFSPAPARSRHTYELNRVLYPLICRLSISI